MELKSQKWREISLAAELLIVLNGIEIQTVVTVDKPRSPFNRTKWN